MPKPIRFTQIETFLKKFYRKTTNPELYLLHFTNINKIGINPRTISDKDDKTPLGIYGYQLDAFMNFYEGKLDYLPYANDRNYLFLLKISPDAKILTISENRKPDKHLLTKVVDLLVNDFFDILKNHHIFKKTKSFPPKEIFKKELIKILEKYDMENLYKFVHNVLSSAKPTNLLLNKFFRKAGFDVLRDECTGTIYMGEQCQTVILTPGVYEIVKVFVNPKMSYKRKTTPDEIIKWFISIMADVDKLSKDKDYLRRIVFMLYNILSDKKYSSKYIKGQIKKFITNLKNLTEKIRRESGGKYDIFTALFFHDEESSDLFHDVFKRTSYTILINDLEKYDKYLIKHLPRFLDNPNARLERLVDETFYQFIDKLVLLLVKLARKYPELKKIFPSSRFAKINETWVRENEFYLSRKIDENILEEFENLMGWK